MISENICESSDCMARPKKNRRICSLPQTNAFSPAERPNGQIILQMDEYEALRLIDLEGLTQVQCANQMNVARATVTLIYESARKKIAEALVGRKELIISGGDVAVCEHSDQCCGTCGKNNCERCQKNCRKKEDPHE